MPHIIVDDTSAKMISEHDTIEIRDRHGNHLGYVAHGFSAEDIAIAQQRLASNEPRHTTRQVLAHLGSLEKE